MPGPGGWAAWRQELGHFLRALSGAFLFGIPLLYTMEMWWLGTQAGPARILTMIAFALVANFGLNYVTGFKRKGSVGSAIEQSIDAVAVGIVGSLAVLSVLARVSFADPLDEILGKIVVQAIPLSLGSSVASAVFSSERTRQGEDAEQPGHGRWAQTFSDVGATATGAAFLGFSIAPTEEIQMLAAGLTAWHEIALIAFSLAVTYVIVFESGFDYTGAQTGGSFFASPLSETGMAYGVSLVVALAILLLFTNVDPQEPLRSIVAQTLVLGFPAAVGGAAGRLVI